MALFIDETATSMALLESLILFKYTDILSSFIDKLNCYLYPSIRSIGFTTKSFGLVEPILQAIKY